MGKAPGSAQRKTCEFVARAHALVAEVSRLSARAPKALSDGKGKYASALFDYAYFASALANENAIEANARAMECDEELKANYGGVLARYWNAFDAVVRWHGDFIRFVEDVADGAYVSETMETILSDDDGKQCVIEALATFGVILMILEKRFEGKFKERVVVAYYRHHANEDVPRADDVIKLCKSTGYDASAPSTSRPSGYPENYFARFEIPEWLILMVIGRIRTDDVYNQAPHYPNPEHRSTALAAQGGHLYVILYWAPKILRQGKSAMREIVDRHYADNWVIAYGPGLTADLLAEWEPYESASTALRNAVTPQAARDLVERSSKSANELKGLLTRYLTDGALTEEFVLSNEKLLMNTVRDANVVARFLLLHNTMTHKSVSSCLSLMPSRDKIIDLLLDCAELENELKSIYTALLSGKNAMWEKCKSEAGDRMRELSTYFGGTAGLSRNTKDENMRLWFANLSLEVDRLSYDDPIAAGRTIQLLETALIEVEQFHQIVNNIHAKQYLLDSRQYLGKMMMTTNVADAALNTLTIVADAAYAWRIIDPYTSQLQARIRGDPFAVRKLRFLFLKLKSILEMPLLRISQIESPDIYSVSEYYSSQLVTYVRSVVEVIPVSMFEILNEIISVQTTELRELPTKLEKTALKDYAQLTERSQLSKSTYQIAIFTQGILAMERTFMGVIELDPKRLLEEGIRKQLVKQLTESFHEALVFGDGSKDGLSWIVSTMMKTNPFEDRLNALARRLDGFKRSFEYVQDYINIYGLQVWQQETNRVVSYHVEQECYAFLKRKQIDDEESQYQSAAIPIPYYPPLDGESKTFMGRLLRELLKRTDPKTTRYIAQQSAWFNADGTEAVGIRTFALLTSAVGNVGLAGLDRLLSFATAKRLQACVEAYSERLAGELGVVIQTLARALQPLGGIPENSADASNDCYEQATRKLASYWDDMHAALAAIGQAQLLRRQLNAELVANIRIDSHTFSRVLDTANKAILTDIRAHYNSPDTLPYPDESNAVVPTLSAFLSASGMQNPLRQIYCTVNAADDWGTLLFAFTLSQLALYEFDDKTSGLVPRNRSTTTTDASALILGVSTTLRQLHVDQTASYLALIGQYVRVRVARADASRTSLSSSSSSKTHIFDASTRVAIAWVNRFAAAADVEPKTLARFFPPFILANAFAAII